MARKPIPEASRAIGALGALLFVTLPAYAEIETVVVTAERKSENLQSIPVAVTAFTSKQRDKIGITSIQDMASFTPGMTYSTSTDRVTLRGISRRTNVLAADAGVANYDDGIFQSFAVSASRTSLDVNRVEILRGPQGTLYGRNSIGGTVNILSVRPTDEFYAEFRASYENYDHSNIEGAVSGPITDDWQYRFYGNWERQGLGYTKNVIPGKPEEGNVIDTWFLEAQLQGKIGSSLDIWTKVYSTAWANGAGGPGSASGGWSPADYPTFEVGQGGQLINPGYGCTVYPAQPLTPTSDPNYPKAGADTTVASATSPLVNPCQNPAVKDPWHIARITPYTVQLPGSYFGTLQATYHTGADFDIKYIGGAEWYRYVLHGPLSTGGGGVYPAPISTIVITAEPGGACATGVNYNTGPTAVTQYNNCVAGNAAADNLLLHPQESFAYQQQEFFTQNEINFQSTGSGPLEWQTGLYSFFDHTSQPVSASDVGQTQLDTHIETLPPSPLVASQLGGIFSLLPGTLTGALGGPPTVSGDLPLPFIAAPDNAGPFNSPPHQPLAERVYDDRPTFDLRSLGVYAQAGYKFLDEFKVTAGVRYSNDRKAGTELSRLGVLGVIGGLNAPENLGSDTPGFDITPPQVGIVDYFDKNHSDLGVVGPACYQGPQAAAQFQCPAGTPAPPGFAFRRYAHSSDAITGTFNLDWTPDDTTLAYAKYSRGYKAGGYNTGIGSFINPKPWVGPEHVNAAEVGLKKTFGEGWLVLDTAVYYYDYTNIQTPTVVPAPPGGVAAPEFINIPRAINEGAEAEAFLNPFEHFNAIVSYSYNDAHISSRLTPAYDVVRGTNFQAGVVDPADPTAQAPGAQPLLSLAQCAAPSPSGGSVCPIDLYTTEPIMPIPIDCRTKTTAGFGCVRSQSLKGNRLPNAPRNKIAINLSYDWVLPEFGTFTPSVTYRWESVQYGTIFTRFYNRAPAWNQWDVRLGFSSPDSHWQFYLYGKNLANSLGYAQGAIGSRYAGSINTGGSSSPASINAQTGQVTANGTYCNGTTSPIDPVDGPHTCYFVQGETLGAPTHPVPGYGAVRGESPYGTVSTYNVNPPTTYGAQLQYKF